MQKCQDCSFTLALHLTQSLAGNFTNTDNEMPGPLSQQATQSHQFITVDRHDRVVAVDILPGFAELDKNEYGVSLS